MAVLSTPPNMPPQFVASSPFLELRGGDGRRPGNNRAGVEGAGSGRTGSESSQPVVFNSLAD